MNRRKYLTLLTAGGVGSIAGCLDMIGNDFEEEVEREVDPTESNEIFQNRLLPDDFETYTSNHVSGGVGQDGIPSIDNPQYTSLSEYDRDELLDEIVFYVEIDGEAKAYPPLY